MKNKRPRAGAGNPTQITGGVEAQVEVVVVEEEEKGGGGGEIESH